MRLAGKLVLAAGLISLGLGPVRDALAYTAAGDRIFVATGILPQIAPTDQFYTWAWTLPLTSGGVGAPERRTNVGAVFEMTLGLGREGGGAGAARIAPPKGATTPRVYYGKGLGDLNIGYWRPLAVSGFVGYQASDGAPRPDLISTGFVVEYSIPYLRSKVQSVDMPELFRGMTPMTEVLFTFPAGRSFGARTTALIAPGLNFAGE